MLRNRSFKRNSRQRVFVPYKPTTPEIIEFEGLHYSLKESKDFIRGIGKLWTLEGRLIEDRLNWLVFIGVGNTRDEALENLKVNIAGLE